MLFVARRGCVCWNGCVVVSVTLPRWPLFRAHWAAVLYEVLAVAVPLVHFAFVVVLVGGAFVVYRRPRRWKLHLPAVLAMTAVTGVGVSCPLTVLETRLRQSAGWDAYDAGFISHYLVEPWHPSGITSPIRVAIIAIWLVPNVIAYIAVLRWLRPRSPVGAVT
jgi:hypothetical protein